MDVTVVGGGAIGLCIAEALQRRGASVAVVDAGRFGAGASAGNAGWVTPALSTPLPAPGAVSQALRWMLSSTSPLLIHPTLRPSLLRWLLAFCRHTSAKRYAAGVTALVSLTERTVRDFEALADRGVAFEMHRDGLLFVALDADALAKEHLALSQQQAVGYRGAVEVVDRTAVQELEPAVSPRVPGGIYAADELHVRPETLTEGLAARLRDDGAELLEHTAVRSLTRDGRGWRLVLDAGRTLACERVVVAAGVQTARLLRPLGVRLPLEGAKGYSVTVPSPVGGVRRPLYLLEAKLGVTPYEGAVRLAGTLELGARGLGLNPPRVRALEDAAGRYLRAWPARGQGRAWAGFRPTSPDGLPAIGPVPGCSGLFAATGHVMLGITLAPTTAEVLAPVICGEPAAPQLAPFSLARFRRAGA